MPWASLLSVCLAVASRLIFNQQLVKLALYLNPVFLAVLLHGLLSWLVKECMRWVASSSGTEFPQPSFSHDCRICMSPAMAVHIPVLCLAVELHLCMGEVVETKVVLHVAQSFLVLQMNVLLCLIYQLTVSSMQTSLENKCCWCHTPACFVTLKIASQFCQCF